MRSPFEFFRLLGILKSPGGTNGTAATFAAFANGLSGCLPTPAPVDRNALARWDGTFKKLTSGKAPLLGMTTLLSSFNNNN